MRTWLTASALSLIPASALASPPVVLSGGPDAVAVTLYRDPDRGDGEIDRAQPTAFALISETRTVTLPPGAVTVRFEGVAGGVVPQSAILFGTDPRERNRDAALLSQKGLVDAFTGQQVILRRTDPATGETVEERATIRSAADRMVMTTPRGAEAVYCTGLVQTLIYPHAPATLSAKPVLSMTTKDQPGGRVTMTLAYIATGFDWDATYIGTLAPDEDAIALFAWLTMASGDETSFIDATTSAVAGRVNRSRETRDDAARRALAEARSLDRSSQCWPADTTSDVGSAYSAAPMAPPPAPAPPMMMDMAQGEIVLTAQRRFNVPVAVTAQEEGLGDLKLYRIPVPVTVAARSQKQVAFLNKQRVEGALVYRSQVSGSRAGAPQMLFRFRNTEEQGLGDALPAGKVTLYQDGAFGRQLVGETAMADKAAGDDVELAFGKAGNITIETEETGDDKERRYEVTIRNANPFPVRFEMDFPTRADRVFSQLPRQTVSKPGKRVWAATLPANSERTIGYSIRSGR